MKTPDKAINSPLLAIPRGSEMRVLTAMLMVALGLTAARADNYSGAYVGSGNNLAVMMQLVEGSGGHLTGRFVEVQLLASGSINQKNSVVTGAIGEQTVVLTIKSAEVMAGTLTASGSIGGSTLHLTGGGYGGNFVLNLIRSDESEFEKMVAILTAKSRMILAAKAEAQFITSVTEATKKVVEVGVKVDDVRTKLAAAVVEKRYRFATEWMRTAQARQRTILGDGQAFVARNQISVSIVQAKLQIETLHNEVLGARSAVRSSESALRRDVSEIEGRCESVTVDHKTTIPNDAAGAACEKLFLSLAGLASKVKGLDAAYAMTETVWTEEHSKQEQIVHASEIAAR